MKVTDFNRLKKLMNMTHNENDGEALNALRMANKVLAGAGVDWDRVLNRMVSLDVEDAGDLRTDDLRSDVQQRSPAVDVQKRDKERYIERILSDVEEHATGRFADFIGSLREQWDRTKQLSPLQIDALERSVMRTRR